MAITESRVIPGPTFDLEWLRRIDDKGVTDGWRVWCHLCGDYDPAWHHTDTEAAEAAKGHRHTVDPVKVLQRMRHEIPALLGDERQA